jgi:hypothetical protein
VICAGADNADAYPVALVPTGKSIDDIDAVPGVEVVNRTFAVDTPDLIMSLAKCRVYIRDAQSEDVAGISDCGAAEIQHATCKDGSSSRLSSGMRLACMTSVADLTSHLLRSVLGLGRVSGKHKRTYVGFHRLVDWTPPNIVL